MKAPDDTGDPTLSLVSSTTPGDGRRRRQTTKKTKGVDGLPPCLVCGEPASGLHYGVNSCSACKAFFFRNWMRRDHLVCEGDGSCLSVPGSGLGCPACRMKRCLKAGMSLTGTRRGRYTHETRVKIKRDAKKMLGDETIKASVKAVQTSVCPQANLLKSHISSDTGTDRMSPMDYLETINKDILEPVPNLLQPTSKEDWEMPASKMEAIPDENVQFYEDLSLKPLDLSKGDVSASAGARTEAVESGHRMTTTSALVDDSGNPGHNNSTLQVYSPQYLIQDRVSPTGPLKYEYPSFLYLMNMMDDEDSDMSISVEPENLSRGSESSLVPPQDPHLPPGSANPFNSQSANYTDLQVIQPSLIFNSGGENEETDDYTRLQNIICALLSTPKSARIKLKTVAENITSTYKVYDPHPDGFFETVDNVQRTFLEQKALHKVVFGDMKPIPQEEYLQIYHATGLDIDGRRALVEKNKTRYEEWYLKYIKFAKSLPYFQDLPVQDQIAILKAAKTQYIGLCDYRAFDPDRVLYTDNNGDTYDFDDFNKVFSKAYINVMADFVRALRSLYLTEDERNVMKCICLFTPDYCVTEEGREKAKERYVQLVTVLAHLLIENHGDDPTFQTRLLQARELSKTFSIMDSREKWKAFHLYSQDPGSIPISVELFCPTKKDGDVLKG